MTGQATRAERQGRSHSKPYVSERPIHGVVQGGIEPWGGLVGPHQSWVAVVHLANGKHVYRTPTRHRDALLTVRCISRHPRFPLSPRPGPGSLLSGLLTEPSSIGAPVGEGHLPHGIVANAIKPIPLATAELT
jgi:hypothetical protein